jgi:predicted DNA-binding transcriptional regulator AlpA
MHASNDNEPRLISVKDACAMTSLSRTSISKLRAAGNFPRELSAGSSARGEAAWFRPRRSHRVDRGTHKRARRIAAGGIPPQKETPATVRRRGSVCFKDNR